MVLPYAIVTHFDQRGIGDPVSDTDLMVTEFDLTVQCLVYAQYLSLMYPKATGNTGNPADVINIITNLLMQRRKQLQVSFNNVNIIPGPHVTEVGTVDAMNGPIPRQCVFTQMTDTSWLMTYHITARYAVNPQFNAKSLVTGNQVGGDVLSNRWSESVSMDRRQRSVRTRQGKFIIRSDKANTRLADELRSQMAILSIPEGFIRAAADYTIDPTGLGIEYRIVDEEQWKLPVQPAFVSDGDYTESTTHYGGQRFGEVRVHLEGDNQTLQTDLISSAILVAMEKLRTRFNTLGFKTPFLIEVASVRQGLWDNTVDFNVRCRMPISPAPSIDPSQGMDGFSKMDDFNGDVGATGAGPQYLDRGTADILLQAAIYNDPTIQTGLFGQGVTVADNKLTPYDNTLTKRQLVPGPGEGSQVPGTTGATG